MINIPIINLNGGEYSPLVDVRADVEKYSSGCRKLDNFIPRIHGAIERRPGTRFVKEAK